MVQLHRVFISILTVDHVPPLLVSTLVTISYHPQYCYCTLVDSETVAAIFGFFSRARKKRGNILSDDIILPIGKNAAIHVDCRA